ncbi:MAG: LuxR C-terminal-related transcriptional regulator [Geminicoccaceae bacterium]
MAFCRGCRQGRIGVSGNPASAIRAGEQLLGLSRLAWIRGRGRDARQHALDAVRVLERVPPGPELAMAYGTMAQLYMLAGDGPAAVEWGGHALQIAEPLGLTDTIVHTLNSVGTAELFMGETAGRAKLERSLELARAAELHEHAARALLNLGHHALAVREHERALQHLAAGFGDAQEHDLASYTFYAIALRSRANLELGRWQEAGADANLVLEGAAGANSWLIAAAVAGALRVRRGDPDAATLLGEASERAWAADEIRRIGPIAAARAEAAWLAGDAEQPCSEIADAFDLALRHPEPWQLGELGLWLWRAGRLDQPPEPMALPYRLEIDGDWQGAAAVWSRLGCPYEEALALAGGDQPAQLRALDLLRSLEAAPAAALVRRRLHADGARGIPRGPRAATRQNPLGMTVRQVDILRLLAEGLSNKEIAARLAIAPKTVDHHVCAVLAKLEVTTRKQAARHPVTQSVLAELKAG